MNNFSTTLKDLRLSASLTQGELAKKLGIAKSTVSMYENDRRAPDFETLEAIADLFNVDMNYLLGHSAETTALPNGVVSQSRNAFQDFISETETTELLRMVLAADDDTCDYEYSDEQLLSILNYARFIARE